MRQAQRDRSLERLSPDFQRLVRQAVHQVDADVVEAEVACKVNSGQGVICRVPPGEGFQQRIVE